MKRSMVRRRMGLPRSSMNCLGRTAPIRVPLPPAVTTKYFFLSIAKTLREYKDFFVTLENNCQKR